MIEFKELNKWFGAHHVLQDINLEVAKGKLSWFVDPAGLERAPSFAASMAWKNFKAAA